MAHGLTPRGAMITCLESTQSLIISRRLIPLLAHLHRRRQCSIFGGFIGVNGTCRGRWPLRLRYWRRSRLRQTDVAQGDPGAVLAPTRTRYDQHVREIVRKRALLVAMFAAVWILPARSATTQLQARWRSRRLPLTARRRSMQARQFREPRSGLIPTS